MDYHLKGIFAAIVTPYREDGAVDLSSVRRLTRYLLSEGVDGILICGTTGEFPVLTQTERQDIAETVSDEMGPAGKLLVNISSMLQSEAASLIRHAKTIRADGISVVAPWYYKFDQEALFRYFVWVAEQAGELPVYLYNIPANAKNPISPALLKRLTLACPNVHGIKDSSMDFMTYTDYQREMGPGFTVLTGNDAQILPALQAGGAGAVVATAGVFPALAKGIYDDFMAGRLEQAREKQRKIYGFRDLCRSVMPGMAHKKALELLGFSMGPPRLPFRELDPAETGIMRQGLQDLGLL